MAPTPANPDSLLLCSLDKCLNGDHCLLSWRQALEALSDLELAKSSPNLARFLNDGQTIAELQADLDSHRTPTPQTASDFEARTAAINVTPSQTGRFDIQQIKDDTIWLSTAANIDEVSALRLAVLEWQERPAARILQGYTEEEVISIRQATGDASFGASVLAGAQREKGEGSKETGNSFTSDNSRRTRLMRWYMSERENFFSVSFLLRTLALPATPIAPRDRTYGPGLEAQKAPQWLEPVLKRLRDASVISGNGTAGGDRIKSAIELLGNAIQRWELTDEKLPPLGESESVDEVYSTFELSQVVLLLKLIFVQLSGLTTWATASNVQIWFEFVNKVSFFEFLEARFPSQQPLCGPIQALVSIITLQMLRLPYAIDHLSQAAPSNRPIPFIYDGACRDQVDLTLGNAANRNLSIASPAVLAWSMILQTLRERVRPASEETSDDENSSVDGSPVITRQRALPTPAGFQTALQAVLDKSANGDLIDFYAHSAVDGASVLAVISTLSQVLLPALQISWNVNAVVHANLTLFELARQALVYTTYTVDMLATVLAILGAGGSEQSVGWNTLPVQSILAEAFTKDHEIFVPHLLHQAQTRYPYELSPFLKLFKALAIPEDTLNHGTRRILPLAEPNSTFTQELPKDFTDYKLIREDENANSIELTHELPMFLPRRAFGFLRNGNDSAQSWLGGDSEHEPLRMVIPAGTVGVVMTDSKPFVVGWEMQHSVLCYLGCLLSSMTPSSSHRDIGNNGDVDHDIQADIIGLMTALIIASREPQSTSSPKTPTPSAAMWVLEEASDYLGRNRDIISVVFEIYEQELSRQAKRADDSIELLLQCLSFFTAALGIAPGRIWPLLARSSLLSVSDRGGKVAAIIGSLDTIVARYSLIRSTLALYDTLVQDVAGHVAHERHTSVRRFNVKDERTTGLPQSQISKILHALTRTMLSLLDSTQSWPSSACNPREIIVTSMAKTFNKVLSLVYCNGDAAIQPEDDVCGAIAESSHLLLDAFILSADAGLATNRFMSTFSDSPATTLDIIATTHSSKRKTLILGFLTNLLQVSFNIETTSSHLEKQLFQSLPLLARCYITTEIAKVSILKLLTTLVRKAGLLNEEPPSLLGHLGPEVAWALLTILQSLNRPLEQANVGVGVWDLCAAVVSNKQQWFSSFLITGDIPKRSSKGTTDSEDKRRKALLSVALDTLSRTKSYETLQGLAMLRFILQSQNYYPLVSMSLERHDQFLTTALQWVADLRTSLNSNHFKQTNQTYAAALIADILAMYIHNLRQLGSPVSLDTFTPHLGFYRDNGVRPPDYNVSLHSNLKRNFETSFTSCKLDSFKRRAGESQFGISYFYDLDFADAMLGHHQTWRGSNGGFRGEFEKANVNLSLVESQILLMKGWQSLIIELTQDLAGNESLQKQVVTVINNCLSNNSQQNLHETVFERLLQQRADLALILLQRLISVRSNVSSIKLLLKNAWQIVQSLGLDPDIVFQGSATPYYRTAIQILLLTLQPYTYAGGPVPSLATDDLTSDASIQSRPYDIPPETLTKFLAIVSEITCKGFRSLCSQLHADVSTVDPADFGLLVGMLQTILRIPHISTAYAQLTIRISATGVHRYAMALFSWSDRLLTSPNAKLQSSDPVIFTDLSISFLRELSTIPPLAEFLATEGILGQLVSAPILGHLQENNDHDASQHAGSLNNGYRPPHLARLQTIWSRSILPLILNTLISAGPSFAPEATSFLATFPSQLSRASQSLDPEGGPPPSKNVNKSSSVRSGVVTLPAAAEVHTLCMIDLAITSAMDSPACIAGLIGDCLPASWDRAGVKEDLEAWLGTGTGTVPGSDTSAVNAGKREALRERIVPTSEWEEGLLKAKTISGDGAKNRLEEMIVAELKGALACLNR